MNAYERLVAIRDRLKQDGARQDSIAFVERFIKRAERERDMDMSVTQSVVINHLLRQREALDNYGIYDDLQKLDPDMKGENGANSRSFYKIRTRIRQSRNWRNWNDW